MQAAQDNQCLARGAFERLPATGRAKARDEGLAGVPLVGADTGVPRLLAETPIL